MKKKHIIAIGVFVITVGFLFLNEYFTSIGKEITQDEALKEMPYIGISVDEISLMNKLKDDHDIRQAILDTKDVEVPSVNFSVDELNNVEEIPFPENSAITVHLGQFFVAYGLDGYTINLWIDPDGSIRKTVLLLRSNNSIKRSWENHNNETYKKYQFGLF